MASSRLTRSYFSRVTFHSDLTRRTIRVKFGYKGYSSFAAIRVQTTDRTINEGAYSYKIARLTR